MKKVKLTKIYPTPKGVPPRTPRKLKDGVVYEFDFEITKPMDVDELLELLEAERAPQSK